MKRHFDERERSSGPKYMAREKEIRRIVKEWYGGGE